MARSHGGRQSCRTRRIQEVVAAGSGSRRERERVLPGEELRDLRLKFDEMENVYATAPPGTKYSDDRPLKRKRS